MSTIPFPQGSPDPTSPLWPHVAPCHQNCNDSANAARLLFYCGDRLVLVLPEESDEPDTPAVLYGVKSTGMLSWREARTLIKKAADRYAEACEYLTGRSEREYRECASHAARMKNRTASRAIRDTITAVVLELMKEGSLPDGVVIAHYDDIDADLTTIGTPILPRCLGPAQRRDTALRRGPQAAGGHQYPGRVRPAGPPSPGGRDIASRWPCAAG